MNYYAIFSKHLSGIKKSSNGNFLAKCPFHDDKNPSFSFNPENGLFKCFGCGGKGNAYQFLEKLGYAKEEILKELSEVDDRYRQKPKLNSLEELKNKYKQHKVYFYLNKNRDLLYKKHRFENPKIENLPQKTFYIEWKTQNKKLILYNIQSLNDTTETIYLTEGEKCAEKVLSVIAEERISVVGFNNFKKEFENSDVKEFFKDKKIVIFADNDEVGTKKANEIIETLKGTVKEIKLIQFRDKPQGYDIADWIEEGKLFQTAFSYAEIVYRNSKEYINLEELIHEELPNIEHTTRLNFPIGKLTLTAGLGDSGKTLLSIYTSFELLKEGKNVAFISLEDDILDYKRRIKKLYANNPFKQNGNLVFEFFEGKNIIELVENYMKEGIDFIFIDPIGSLFEDENSNSLVQPVMKNFNSLCNRYKKNIVLLHHLNKSGMQIGKKSIYDLDKFELQGSIRGASALTSNARHILFLRRKKEDKDRLEVLTIKNNFGKKPDFEVRNLLNLFETTNSVEIIPLNETLIKRETEKEIEEGLPF